MRNVPNSSGREIVLYENSNNTRSENSHDTKNKAKVAEDRARRTQMRKGRFKCRRRVMTREGTAGRHLLRQEDAGGIVGSGHQIHRYRSTQPSEKHVELPDRVRTHAAL
jgi:hypothetical protein